MKKILTLIVALMATTAVAHAQFGIIGGWTTSRTSINTKNFSENFKGLDNFHAGIAYKVKLPLGFAVQPELTYEMKGAKIDHPDGVFVGLSSTKAHCIELGMGVQWGVDLLVVRPFLVAEPFVGYQFANKEVISAGSYPMDIDGVTKALNDAKNKLDYGISLGGGIELVRHIQLTVKWYKNLGPLFNEGKLASVGDAVVAAYKDTKNYQGIKVTLGIFF
jgi:hypothetical protein